MSDLVAEANLLASLPDAAPSYYRSRIAAVIARLVRERDEYKDDYLRRHKDACDHYMEVIRLREENQALKKAIERLTAVHLGLPVP